jgi:purine nucleosidase
MRKFWIDTDTASDDAVALVMAHQWSDVEVLGVSIVAGNVPVEKGVRNALKSIEICGKATPTYIGCDRPLLRPIEFATWFHGDDGMGNQFYPDAKLKAHPGHGVDALIETVKANPGEITLVTLGPLTNLATALIKAPEIADLIPRTVIMGGAANTVGNVTPAAEYNIWVDPEAAYRVFHAPMPMEMVGWELSRAEAAWTTEDMESARKLGTERAIFAVDCNKVAYHVSVNVQKAPGVQLADPVAMAVALSPETIVKRSGRYFVEVETVSPFMRGNTTVDEIPVLTNTPNMGVVWSIYVDQFKEMLMTCLQ